MRLLQAAELLRIQGERAAEQPVSHTTARLFVTSTKDPESHAFLVYAKCYYPKSSSLMVYLKY